GGQEGEPWFPLHASRVGPALPGRLSCTARPQTWPTEEGEPWFPLHAPRVGPALPGRLSCTARPQTWPTEEGVRRGNPGSPCPAPLVELQLVLGELDRRVDACLARLLDRRRHHVRDHEVRQHLGRRIVGLAGITERADEVASVVLQDLELRVGVLAPQ